MELLEQYTNDDIACERIFKIKDKKENYDCMGFIARVIQAKSICIFRFATRYLLRNTDVENTQRLLSKYIIACVYFTIRYYYEDFIYENLSSDYLNSLYDNGLSLSSFENIPDEDNKFIKLLKVESGSVKALTDEIFDEIKTYSLKNNILNVLDDMKNRIYYRNNYFQLNTRFSEFKAEKKSCDLLIAEARAMDINRNFKLDFLDETYDSFLENLNLFNKKGELETKHKVFELGAKIIIANLVNDAITNNLSLEETPTISSSDLKCYGEDYELLISRKNNRLINFLKPVGDNFYVELDKIKEFKISYNNKLYLFSDRGLIEI